ncbi:MAG TPA: ABC transporter substrate-binding protein [Candidatus Dormibacteraeota bacterium]|jgi:putative spermidine/putrescine transport system substrate-binding protein|nr:ABC transporter substrate-binding protein [Candidatus Dormibacteraeota bacterium]
MKPKTTIVLAVAVCLCMLLSFGGGTAFASGSGGVSPSKATSAAKFGGMSKLISAAKKEKTLNVITLPADWANYGAIMKDFTKKYGIKIVDENPDGSSQDEVNAMKELKGQSRAPDVLDMGTSFAIEAAQSGLLTPYKVASWKDIPSSAKAGNGDWYDDYGGYVAIGYDPSKVKTPPKSFADLLKPRYKNMVGINGNPTQAGAAFAAVFAASLANGGSFNNIQPGIQYFQKLKQAGNFVPVTASAATVQSGQTPIVIYWDYLQASQIKAEVPNWKIVIPTDGHYASYYSQAVSATAPHPAAARLWEEYLYSTTGQNLWLQGYARPIELPTLVAKGSVDKKAYEALPPAPKGKTTFPSSAQLAKAETVVTQQWAQVLSS